MKKLLAAAAIAVFSATGAYAADMAVYKKAPPIAPWSWTGSYIGGFIGGAFTDPRTSVPMNGGGVPLPGFLGATSYDLSPSVIVGITSGYNWQFAPNWLIGYESETGYIHMTGNGIYPGTAPAVISATEMGNLYSAWTARFGYVMDKSLLYVKGGAVLGEFKTDVFDAAATVILHGQKYRLGYAVGGGWEYAFDPKWSIKAEYLYLGFDGQDVTFTGNSIGATRRGAAVISQEFATTSLGGVHTAKIGLNYKWDWFGILR